ncbi:MAG: hypothetical protein GY926_01350, partial [bacterium]|nr:hypothetical protein [bacterium]
LTGTLVLQNNGGDDLILTADGAFAFTTALADGSAYDVTVLTQPAGQICTITTGSGTLAGADVTNVAANCVNAYTVGGTVSGLIGTLVLQNNGGDDLILTADGAFTFATALVNGSAYNVTVLTAPAGQICTITAGSGTIAGANATSVAANCVFTAPVVYGLAWFMDINGNASCDAGDQVVVQFDQPVVVNSAGGGDLELPVTGDSFGAGATVSAGPESDEVTVTLGASPSLKSRGTYAGVTGANSPSGVDVSGSMALDAIEGLGGLDAVDSTPLDLAPAFLSSGQALGSGNSRSVVLGDVDGDGDLDIAVGNDGSANRIYLNAGAGTFTDSGQALGSGNSRSLALGDVDGDGDLDLAVGNYSNQANRIYLNDGAGTFTDSGQALGSSNSYSTALGDVDGDGDLDLAVGNYSQANRIYLNDGAGAFTDSGLSLGSYNSRSVALGDVDGDGDLDFAVANNSNANRIYLNDGAGAFTDSGQALGSAGSRSIALGDVDGDGDLDLAVGNGSGQGNRIYLNDGAGAFTDSGQAIGSGDSHSVALGDVDGDGDLDLAVVNYSGEANRIYLNDGAGAFTDSGQALGSGNSWSVALGDVDGDGDLDFAVANYGQANHVYLNSLSGTWGVSDFADSGQALGSGSSYGVALGDVDGDGDLDLAVGNSSGEANRIYLNDGTGTFTDSAQALGSGWSLAIALGDVDGDGDLDLAVGNVDRETGLNGMSG